jgi:hypothetical protein
MTEQTTSECIEVSRAIAATPAAMFAVLRDPGGHIAIDASGMLMWASGSPASTAGDSFVVHMDRDALRDLDLGEYEMTVTFVTYEQDREIAWTVGRTADERFGSLDHQICGRPSAVQAEVRYAAGEGLVVPA